MEPSTQDLCPSRLFSTVVFPISPTNILNLECHRYNPTTHGTFHAIIQVTLPPLYFPGSISCSHCLAGRPNRTQVASLLQGGVVGGGLCHLYLPPRKLAYYPKRGYLKRIKSPSNHHFFIWDVLVFGRVFQLNFSRIQIRRFGPNQPTPPKKNNSNWWWFEKTIVGCWLLMFFFPRFLGRNIVAFLDDLHSYPSWWNKIVEWNPTELGILDLYKLRVL